MSSDNVVFEVHKHFLWLQGELLVFTYRVLIEQPGAASTIGSGNDTAPIVPFSDTTIVTSATLKAFFGLIYQAKIPPINQFSMARLLKLCRLLTKYDCHVHEELLKHAFTSLVATSLSHAISCELFPQIPPRYALALLRTRMPLEPKERTKSETAEEFKRLLSKN